MTYTSIAAMRSSTSLQLRIAACASTQDVGQDPVIWVSMNMWQFVTQDGWAQAWDDATAEHDPNVNPDTGARTDVITDDMILTAVQQVRANQVSAQQPAGDGSGGSAA